MANSDIAIEMRQLVKSLDVDSKSVSLTKDRRAKIEAMRTKESEAQKSTIDNLIEYAADGGKVVLTIGAFGAAAGCFGTDEVPTVTVTPTTPAFDSDNGTWSPVSAELIKANGWEKLGVTGVNDATGAIRLANESVQLPDGTFVKLSEFNKSNLTDVPAGVLARYGLEPKTKLNGDGIYVTPRGLEFRIENNTPKLVGYNGTKIENMSFLPDGTYGLNASRWFKSGGIEYVLTTDGFLDTLENVKKNFTGTTTNATNATGTQGGNTTGNLTLYGKINIPLSDLHKYQNASKTVDKTVLVRMRNDLGIDAVERIMARDQLERFLDADDANGRIISAQFTTSYDNDTKNMTGKVILDAVNEKGTRRTLTVDVPVELAYAGIHYSMEGSSRPTRVRGRATPLPRRPYSRA